MDERTIREEMLLGRGAVEKLKNSHVAVFGLGGVGSWCCEGLARAGVGRLTLVDRDTVSLSNCNRQLCALTSTLGMEKTAVMAARAGYQSRHGGARALRTLRGRRPGALFLGL